MRFEYQGYILEIFREGEHCYSTECSEPNLKLFNTLRANITLDNLINQFKEEVDMIIKNNINTDIDRKVLTYERLKTRKECIDWSVCDSSNLPTKLWMYSNLIDVLLEQIRLNEEKTTESKVEKKEFEYKGFTLKLGLVADHTKQTVQQGGHCEALNYKTFGEDEEANITKFKKYVNWKISEKNKIDKTIRIDVSKMLEDFNKGQNKFSTILQQYNLQLERLALRDKKDEFSPFELRRQLIEISVLFSGILDKTLEDVKKDYCDRYSKVE